MDRNGKMPDGDKRSSERKAGGTGGGGGKGCVEDRTVERAGGLNKHRDD